MNFIAKEFIDLGASSTVAYQFLVEEMEAQVEVPKIPEDEKWIFENPEIVASIQRGVSQAERGEVFDLGDFSQYADQSDD